jgi:hypothetical protein
VIRGSAFDFGKESPSQFPPVSTFYWKESLTNQNFGGKKIHDEELPVSAPLVLLGFSGIFRSG